MKLFSKLTFAVVGGIIGFLLAYYVKYNTLPIVIVGEHIGSIADIVGAIGTVGAVVVALFTSKNDKKPNLSFYCDSIENTTGFNLNVQNNSNRMVCLISLTNESDKFILCPIGMKDSNGTSTLVSSSSRVLKSLPSDDGERRYTFHDTISNCYYEVVIETINNCPSVKTYYSFYSKCLHELHNLIIN